MMNAIQPPGAAWHGNPFIGLQAAYDQMQSSSDFFTRTPAHPGPQQSSANGGFSALGLNISSFLLLFSTLGVVLMAKIVLGILLALGPLFVAFLLFDGTRGIFEGWLRAVLAFAFLPLFATLALVVQITLLAPHLVALARMALTNQANLPAATSVLILTLVGAMVSLAGVAGLFIVAIGFKWPAATHRAQTAPQPGAAAPLAAEPGAARLFQPRIVSIGAAAAALDRRDVRIEQGSVPRRFSLGPDAEPLRRAEAHNQYRRSARLRRSASSTRRDS
jgi:type IV secretion system protein VirB6